MKNVALIGNMNNNFFSVSRYLRDAGIETTLFCLEGELEHFHPKADTYSLGELRNVKELDWGREESYVRTKADQIRRDLADYDILIGSGAVPAYFHKAGMQLDVFAPYGYDISFATEYRFGNPWWMAKVWPSVLAQRKGLREAKVFHATEMSPWFEAAVHRWMGKSAKRWYEGIPMVYLPEYRPENLESLCRNSHWGSEFKRIRESCSLMVISHARHVWGGRTSPNTKGTDLLIKGWKKFLRQLGDSSAKLVFMEYGKNIIESKKLVQELGVEDSIVWMPKMYRKDIMVGLMMADLACGHFVNTTNINGVVSEALVAEKPILTFRNEEFFLDTKVSLYPVLSARDDDEICEQLENFIRNQEYFKEQGKENRIWYEKQVVRKSIDRYLGLIKA